MSRAPEPALVVAVVPVFNGEGLVGPCLDALLDSDQPALEIVVVDDGSRDASVAVAQRAAARSGGRIQVLALGRNHGFAGAVNRAVAHALARGRAPEVLAFVNQDCIVARGALAALVEALTEPSIAVAGARLLDADGITLQHAGARIETNGLTAHDGRGCRDPLAWREMRDADYVCGALLAMRTATWRRFGPLDEGYAPAYFEEVELCTRVRRAGLRVVYVPASEARHLEASCCGALSRTYLRRYHRSRMRFVVRQQLARVGVLRWLGAEAAWLLRLRRWAEIAPVLAAYARVPLLVAEEVRERRASRSAGGGATTEAAALTETLR